ncbi:RNA methyltransferase [Salinispira pacifica]
MSEQLPPHIARLARFKIVLCNPDSSFNIGAVCRAMKTMGFSRLAIAGRILNDDPEKIRFMAVHAYELFEGAERYETLEEALKDTAISAGVTRRHGRERKASYFLPEEFAMHALTRESGTVGLVFGNEEHGLTTAELAACSASLTIPSSPEFPSLNLSHAVQVVTYSFYRTAALLHYDHGQGGAAAVPGDAERALFGSERPVNQDRLERLVDGMIDSLNEIGFFRISDSLPTRHFLRDIMARATLSPREADKMANIFRKIRHIKP